MTVIRLKYIHRFKDRHGRLRYYFRRGGGQVPLPGEPGSEAFMDAYQAALEGSDKPPVGQSRIRPGSIDALAIAYYQSADFRTMAASSQAVYRGIIERFRVEYGHLRVRKLEPKHIRRILDKKADAPTAANNLLKVLRAMMRFAIEDDWRTGDPTSEVRKVKHRPTGFHTWTEDEIAKFEAKHPIGTRARLALALLLYTGCRRSDVVQLGRQHINGDTIRVQQQKTKEVVELPIHPALAEALTAAPRNHLTFLVTAHGKPFTSNGFYNWFVECAAKAGLPKGCGPHGLRKAISRRLVEAGATTHQLMSVTGHKSLSEAERYTQEANRRRLAREGIAALGPKGEQ